VPILKDSEYNECPYCIALGIWIRTSNYDYLCKPYSFGRFHPNIVVTTAIDCEGREYSVPEALQREMLHTDFLHYFVRLLRKYLVGKEYHFQNSKADFTLAIKGTDSLHRNAYKDIKPGKQFFFEQCPDDDTATVWRITSPLVEWDEISILCYLGSTMCAPPSDHHLSFVDVVHEGKPLGFKSYYLYGGGAVELSQLMSLSSNR